MHKCFLVHSFEELIRNLRLNTTLNIHELDRNKLSISRNWKTGHSIPNSYLKFLYALCNVISHILLSHMKDKTIKGSFSLFCFLTWIRWISRKKNVMFLVSMHWETKLLAGGRHHVSWTASLKTVDFLIWSPYLYLQDGSVAAEDHRHKNYEEIKAKQSTWIAARLKPSRSAVGKAVLSASRQVAGKQCQSHVKCIWQIMPSRVMQSSHFCAEGTANLSILVRSTDCILD